VPIVLITVSRRRFGYAVTRAPWQREWLQVTPEAFEKMVVSFLRQLHGHLHDFTVEHRHSISGPDGDFELDAIARFEALGANFVVLVECKHHRSPVKREVVQVLHDKVRSLAAHKGMLFSTGGFQKGAIEYAIAQKITLVHYTQGGPVYETRARGGPTGPCRDYDAYVVSLSEGGGLRYGCRDYEELTQYLFAKDGS
jgi:restriction system protein